MTVTNHATADGSVQTGSRDRFFLTMSGLLLLILLAGFSRTLYLRLFFEVPPVPTYLHVHGATVTAWFVWLIVQASLVNVNRIDVHRRIGMLGVVIGAAVVPAGLMATLQFVPRLPEMGLPFEQAPWFITWIVWANFHMLLGFVGFLATALLLRRRSDIHKRLMLLATISLMPPPLARIAQNLGWMLERETIFVTVTWLLLFVPILIYDLATVKRIHPATAIGGLCFLLVVFGPVLIAGTDFAQNFVRGLG
jgi:hypothetical protein